MAGDVIHFTTGESWLGWFVAAESGRGLRMLLLADDEQSVVEDLLSRCPGSARQEEGEQAACLRAHAMRALDPMCPPSELQIDLQGTDFQRLVWEALRAIPLGQMSSYAQLASAIGRPTAVRAVAGACAANPLAVVIPCHRVCRSDGGLGGYRWGLWRKCCLLGQEAVATAGLSGVPTGQAVAAGTRP